MEILNHVVCVLCVLVQVCAIELFCICQNMQLICKLCALRGLNIHYRYKSIIVRV